MSYEFKKINEVEILETVSDEAHVLVEEDGAIRRAPKTEVGGGGGSETPDMVITVTQTSGSDITVTSDNFSITEGSMDLVFAAIRSGRAPIIKIRYVSPDLSAYTAVVAEYQAVAYTYGEHLWLKYIATSYSASSSWFGCYMALYSDNSLDSFQSYVLG